MTKAWVWVSLCVAASLLVLDGAEAAGRGPGLDFLGNKKVSAIFTFGDSIVDAGTNTFLPNPAFVANFTPYGQTYFHRPTGRFSDGRLWVDRLSQYLGLPLLQAYLNPSTRDYTQGVDFASAGSGHFESTKATIATIFGGRTVANMDEQLQWFRKVKASLISSQGKKKAEKLVERAIFIVSTGSNDLSWGYALNATMQQLYTPDQVTTKLIDAIYTSTKTLVDEGATKIVLSALGPIGCLPANVAGNNGTCLEIINSWVKIFNSKLPALLDRINQNCQDAHVVYTDQYDVVEGFIKNGAEHGFTKGSHACCGTGDYNGQLGGCGAVDGNGTAIYNLCSQAELGEYVFWDYAHPTEKTYGILAEMFIHGEGVIKPYNISQLCEH